MHESWTTKNVLKKREINCCPPMCYLIIQEPGPHRHTDVETIGQNCCWMMFPKSGLVGHIGKQWGNMFLLFSLKVEKCPTSPSSHPCAVHTPESKVALDHGNGIYWRFLGNKKLSQLGRSSPWIFYETVKIPVKLEKKNKSSLKIIKSTRVRIPKIQIRVSVG